MSPLKILIVDDSAATRSFLKVLLNLGDATLFEAADGERALRIARLIPVDLIIADHKPLAAAEISRILRRLTAPQEV